MDDLIEKLSNLADRLHPHSHILAIGLEQPDSDFDRTVLLMAAHDDQRHQAFEAMIARAGRGHLIAVATSCAVLVVIFLWLDAQLVRPLQTAAGLTRRLAAGDVVLPKGRAGCAETAALLQSLTQLAEAIAGSVRVAAGTHPGQPLSSVKLRFRQIAPA